MDTRRTAILQVEAGRAPSVPLPVQLVLLLALLFAGAFYLSYAQNAWFLQDDFQLIMQYAHALQPQQILDFGNFGRFISRNAYWHYGIKLFELHAPLFYLLNLFFICATSVLIYQVVLKTHGRFAAVVAGSIYFCLPGTIEAYAWLSNSQHLLGHLFVMVFVYRFSRSLDADARDDAPAAALLLLVLLLGLWSNAFMGMVLSLPLWMLITSQHQRRNRWQLVATALGLALFVYFYVRLAGQQSGAYETSFSAATFWKNATFYYKGDAGAALWLLIVVGGAAWSWRTGRLFCAWLFIASLAFMLPFAFLQHQRYGSYSVLTQLFAAWGCWCLACDVLGPRLPRLLPYVGAGLLCFVLLQSLLLPIRYFGQYPSGKVVREQVEQLRLVDAQNPAISRYCFRSEKPVVNTTGVQAWDIPAEWWQLGFGAAFSLFVNGQKTYELVSANARCDATFVFRDRRLERVAE